MSLLHAQSMAVFIGLQHSGRRGFRNIPLYRLTHPVGHLSAGATVSDKTLVRFGYAPPAPMESANFSNRKPGIGRR